MEKHLLKDHKPNLVVSCGKSHDKLQIMNSKLKDWVKLLKVLKLLFTHNNFSFVI
jgi:hypothetical protein